MGARQHTRLGLPQGPDRDPPTIPHSEGPTAATVALLGVIKNYRDLQRPLTIGLLSLSSDRGQFTVDFTDCLLLSQLLIGFKFTEEGIECTSLRL